MAWQRLGAGSLAAVALVSALGACAGRSESRESALGPHGAQQVERGISVVDADDFGVVLLDRAGSRMLGFRRGARRPEWSEPLPDGFATTATCVRACPNVAVASGSSLHFVIAGRSTTGRTFASGRTLRVLAAASADMYALSVAEPNNRFSLLLHHGKHDWVQPLRGSVSVVHRSASNRLLLLELQGPTGDSRGLVWVGEPYAQRPSVIPVSVDSNAACLSEEQVLVLEDAGLYSLQPLGAHPILLRPARGLGGCLVRGERVILLSSYSDNGGPVEGHITDLRPSGSEAKYVVRGLAGLSMTDDGRALCSDSDEASQCWDDHGHSLSKAPAGETLRATRTCLLHVDRAGRPSWIVL